MGDEYYDALTRLAARAVELALSEPELFAGVGAARVARWTPRMRVMSRRGNKVPYIFILGMYCRGRS